MSLKSAKISSLSGNLAHWAVEITEQKGTNPVSNNWVKKIDPLGLR